MSDTSTLTAIKYKGIMIELPSGGGSIDTSNFVTKNDASIYAKIQYITQSDYDNLSPKDSNTLYLIQETV